MNYVINTFHSWRHDVKLRKGKEWKRKDKDDRTILETNKTKDGMPCQDFTPILWKVNKAICTVHIYLKFCIKIYFAYKQSRMSIIFKMLGFLYVSKIINLPSGFKKKNLSASSIFIRCEKFLLMKSQKENDICKCFCCKQK